MSFSLVESVHHGLTRRHWGIDGKSAFRSSKTLTALCGGLVVSTATHASEVRKLGSGPPVDYNRIPFCKKCEKRAEMVHLEQD